MKQRVNEIDNKIIDKAEEFTENALCNVKCLCPAIKEIGLCSGCEVYMALRDYYIDEIMEGAEK